MAKVESRVYKITCDSCGNELISDAQDHGNNAQRCETKFPGLGGPRPLIMLYRVDFDGEKTYEENDRSETNVCVVCIVRMLKHLITDLGGDSI